MRVIAGEAGGIPLVAPKGLDTRPTSDKVKGAIFSVLGDSGCEGRVLDLYAGSGALGIEALSRGADFCDFVEHAAAACRAIRTNLTKTKLEDRAAIHQQPAERFLATPRVPYHLILMDPPYALPNLEAVLGLLAASGALGPRTTLLVEHSSRRPPPVSDSLTPEKTRVHGDTAFSLYLPS